MNERLPLTIFRSCVRGVGGGSRTAVLWEAPLSETERCQLPGVADSSHVAFISRDDPSHDASIRFFTSTGELPACGHGTLAALAFLADAEGKPVYSATLRIAEKSVLGEAAFENGRGSAAFDPGEIHLSQARPQEVELALDALGRAPAILAGGIRVATIGRPRLLVPIRTRRALAQLIPDLERLQLGSEALGLLGCYAYTSPTSEGRLAARMFAPAIGVPEDVANANSTACLAAYLAGGGTITISVEMGDSLGAPATILATASDTHHIRVGGAVEIAERIHVDLR